MVRTAAEAASRGRQLTLDFPLAGFRRRHLQGLCKPKSVMPGDNLKFNVTLFAMEERLRFASREGGRTVGVVAKIIA